VLGCGARDEQSAKWAKLAANLPAIFAGLRAVELIHVGMGRETRKTTTSLIMAR